MQSKMIDTGHADSQAYPRPEFEDQHFSHREECDEGIELEKMLQHAESQQLGCDIMGDVQVTYSPILTDTRIFNRRNVARVNGEPYLHSTDDGPIVRKRSAI